MKSAGLPGPLPADDLVDSFWRDGVVLVRGMFADWVEPLREAAATRLGDQEHPVVDVTAAEGGTGRFAMDRQTWWHHSGFRSFLTRSACVDVVRTLLGARERINLLDDQLFVKEPGTSNDTPWHQDLCFWAVEGSQICSLWLALDPVRADTGRLEFVQGSHRDGRRFQAVGVRADESLIDPEHVSLAEVDRSGWRYLAFDLAPGDALVFHALTLHSSSGNQSMTTARRAYVSRWAGDDVVYAPRAFSAPRHLATAAAAGLLPGRPVTSDYYPLLWSRDASSDQGLTLVPPRKVRT